MIVDLQGALLRQDVRAEDPTQRPAPGGGAGTLSITDERTGKTYKVSNLQKRFLPLLCIFLMPETALQQRAAGRACASKPCKSARCLTCR